MFEFISLLIHFQINFNYFSQKTFILHGVSYRKRYQFQRLLSYNFKILLYIYIYFRDLQLTFIFC